MAAPFLIIDGYNLLHAAGLARVNYGPGDLERARHRLVSLLAEKLRADERPRCQVIFDAQQAPADSTRHTRHHGISVDFALPGQDADTAIEQLVARHPAGQRLIVVSGDRRLQKAAKRKNAVPVDSDAFLNELNRRESISPLIETSSVPAVESKSHDDDRVTRKKDDWQTIFGEIDIAALADEVGREPLPGGDARDADSSRIDELQRQLDDPGWLEKWLGK